MEGRAVAATAIANATALQVFEADWLASQPVFYNEQTRRVSHNVNDVIDFRNLEFDADGFNNYLTFGYSVFQQTPIRHVKFLAPATRLTVRSDGSLALSSVADPVAAWLGRTSSEADALDALEVAVRRWERSTDGDIVIPTSGGYDSRLLNWLVRDKRRIRSFTFGLSRRQEESHEVVYARALAQRLNTHWQHITLGDCHQYFDDWDLLFGISTHAHGMYQLEFYDRIAQTHSGGLPLLSGIIGDAWAGDVEIEPICSPAELTRLGYTHGMHADTRMSLLHSDGALAAEYFERNRDQLADERFRVVEAMRFKIVLLTYLLRVPAHFGFRPWSPYLQPDIALRMLTLPAQRRAGRRWQQELFARHKLDLETLPLPVDRRNTLNQQALARQPLRPLSVQLLREVLRPDYVRWINATVTQSGALWERFWSVVMNRRWGRPFRRRGLRDRRMEAYCAYLTLRPIENALRRRNCVRVGRCWRMDGDAAHKWE
jgi:hypothetical protein